MEREWGKANHKKTNRERILRDFYKILDADCKWKVMSFTLWGFGEPHWKKIRETMEKIVKIHRSQKPSPQKPKAEILLLCWDDRGVRFFRLNKKKHFAKFGKGYKYSELGFNY
jgi:hypothetical protein